ncbi:glutaredoxin family protein [Nocardia yamanashiensis]|uniref:glutaredoxin family protein n=1 Tax=Nocardia yamanashiensis TaxID=209247 RepID=UPI00082E0037|nr:glutaredoxin family protein [Nocardia yamanashiensis]UGT40041.1 glutaredoxin family protein [Nocardia yamanashiensis]
MDENVRMYGADWCGDCRRAKTWLREQGVAFTEIDVEHDEAARNEAIRLAGGRKNIPVIVVPSGAVLVEPTNADLAAALGR